MYESQSCIMEFECETCGSSFLKHICTSQDRIVLTSVSNGSKFNPKYEWYLCRSCFSEKNVLSDTYAWIDFSMAPEITSQKKHLESLLKEIRESKLFWTDWERYDVLNAETKIIQQALTLFKDYTSKDTDIWLEFLKTHTPEVSSEFLKEKKIFENIKSEIKEPHSNDLRNHLDQKLVFTDKTFTTIRFVLDNQDHFIPNDDINSCELILDLNLISTHLEVKKLLNYSKFYKIYLDNPIIELTCGNNTWVKNFKSLTFGCANLGIDYAGAKYAGAKKYHCRGCKPVNTGFGSPYAHLSSSDYLEGEIKKPKRKTSIGNKKHWKDR
jgi:hypothetical protein